MPQGRVIVADLCICNVGQFLCKNNQLQICFIDFIGTARKADSAQGSRRQSTQSDSRRVGESESRQSTIDDDMRI